MIRTRTFKSGNSVALRLPKALGIREGVEMRVREEQGRYVVEPVNEPPMTWPATILTLYPDMFPGPLGHSLAGRALQDGIWSLDTVQIRDFATDRHRSVDDTPAGGGAGMVMRADVLAAALDDVLARRPTAPMLAMTPRGRPLDQALVRELAGGPGVSILCGRFEGIDERLFDARPILEVSVGDYILSGGEVAATVVLDACVRLLPGVMGAAISGEEESFEAGLLEYPHYTRPVIWEGRTIPEVLRSGDHAKIAAWRRQKAEEMTRLRRPDLIERHGDARRPPPSGAQRTDKDD
jgi:tRNA (guanine37-N1)-methyltransferase